MFSSAAMFKLVSLFAAARLAAATTYTLEDSYTSSNFMDEFDFFTGPDPTFGNVTYQAADAAVSAGLAGTSNGAIYLGADHTNTYPSGGRPSTRVSSKKTYTKMLLIADLSHMPVGCGTWPALWSFGPSWPSNGEIDIIEGVNDQASDEITLHTSEGCTMTQGTTLAGTTLTGADCGAGNGNDGCPQTTTGSNNYGVNLNSIGGGVSAMEWTSSTISIWWFARGTDIANQLSGSSNGTSTVDVSTFGTPTAQFVGGSGCDIDSNFAEHQIIIDTTFCGSWAGSANAWSSCAASTGTATCNDYVNNNPSAFVDAYWLFNYINVYTASGSSSSPSATSAGTSPSATGSSTWRRQFAA